MSRMPESDMELLVELLCDFCEYLEDLGREEDPKQVMVVFDLVIDALRESPGKRHYRSNDELKRSVLTAMRLASESAVTQRGLTDE